MFGQVEDRLRAALQRGGFSEWSVYAVRQRGFAIVTRLETIERDGRPVTGRRWQATDPSTNAATRSFSLFEYLRALVSANRGRYRVIVLLVTDQAVVPGEEGELPPEGAAELPREWRRKPLGPGYACNALVYEFYRASDEDEVVLVGMGLPARDHIVRAGLWTVADLTGNR
jgi:hypothetical protein